MLASPTSHRPPSRFALWNLGFRPFYLLAAMFSVFAVLLWTAQYLGLVPMDARGPIWHAHEMLFGYTTAVIAGFLLTAVRNWTNRPTPDGVWLMALAALWVAGRALMLTQFDAAAAVINAAFPAAIAIAIGIPLVRARNTRNYFFIGLLLLIGALGGLTHFALSGSTGVAPAVGIQLVLDVVLFIIVVMSGRVIPMFTNNAIPGAQAARRSWVERLALGTIVAVFVCDLLQLPASVIAIAAFAGTFAHGVRLWLWRPARTIRTPLVWILHAAYAWVVIHLALRGLAHIGWLLPSLATHALTIGAIGGLTIGMMTRTARGHTGRPLRADKFDVAAYVLVQAAAVSRVLGGLLVPAQYMATVATSGLLWAVAFAVYAVRYWPVLTRARLDGKPG